MGTLTKIRTGKLDANASSINGKYPFFTCSRESLRIDSHSYECECVLVAGNGDLNVKYYDGKFDAYQRTYIIEPLDKDKLHTRYLFHFLDRYVAKLRKLSIGGVIKYIKLGNLAEAPLPLPPLAEQKRIAAILDKADAIRRKRQQALQLTDDFLRSTFLKMFGDPGHSLPLTIAELLEQEYLTLHKDGNHGGSYPRANEFGADGVPFLSAKDIGSTGEIQTDEVKRLNEEKAATLRIGWIEKNDVLLAHNATVGPVSLYRGNFPKALIGTSLTAFRTDENKLLPEFLAEALRSSHFQRQLKKEMAQTTRNQVPITAQRRLTLLIPPKKDQKSFLKHARTTLASKTKLATALKHSESLFKSLQQRAFSGRL